MLTRKDGTNTRPETPFPSAPSASWDCVSAGWKPPPVSPFPHILPPSPSFPLGNFKRILGERGTVYQGIMEFLHLWVGLSDNGHPRPPLQQLQPETLRPLGTLALLLAFRFIIMAQDKLFVESLFFQLGFFCFSVQEKTIHNMAHFLILSG